MKRAAFTLVELMVVIAIIGLLAAMVLPSMSSVFSLARATICRGNLQRLGDAFAIAGSTRMLTVKSSGMADVVGVFPKPMAWPTVPRNAVADEAIYICPEDPIKASAVGDMFKLLEYVCPYGRFPMNTMGGASTFYISRVGEDAKGTYTEFQFQDDYGNGQFEMMDFHGWFDIDGFARVYHSGTIWIPESIPNTPDFSGAYVLTPGRRDGLNTCGDLNAVYYRGKAAFGTQGLLRNHRGKYYDLPDWSTAESNYGINSYAYQYAYGSKCIVLVDYKELIVEVDTPLEAEALLLKSARHLGKVNYLLGDGSVRTKPPLEISPRLNLSAWDPNSASENDLP
jgi:prepilin-type N-terminal cleavage/methylation domain-containing protein/prepilin-type processing-associated H-X9-DG protein